MLFDLWLPWHDFFTALLLTVVLALFHYVSPWLSMRFPGEGHRFVSFTGGVAIAYVFLHMLPELVEQNEPIGHFLSQYHVLTPFVELSIFIAALFGFLLYYALELLAIDKANDAEEKNVWVYALHLGMFCLYNFLITYTMALRVKTGLSYSMMFTAAMALHFVLTDRKFVRLYPKQFSHMGRFILVLALWFGWAVSVFFDPVNVYVVALMVAFLSGSVLLNVFREELPLNNHARFSWFCTGAGIVMLVLLSQVCL